MWVLLCFYTVTSLTRCIEISLSYLLHLSLTDGVKYINFALIYFFWVCFTVNSKWVLQLNNLFQDINPNWFCISIFSKTLHFSWHILLSKIKCFSWQLFNFCTRKWFNNSQVNSLQKVFFAKFARMWQSLDFRVFHNWTTSFNTNIKI